MRSPYFAFGVADVRAGQAPRAAYEQWDGNEQWNYERGRQWAVLAPRDMPLKLGSKLNPQAVKWYGNAIL